jgi:hypothetical protein
MNKESHDVCQYETCTNQAKKKCTKCGKVYCDLHIRYGNPKSAFGVSYSGIGNYCDLCWEQLEKQGKIERILIPVVAILALLIFALGMWWQLMH